MGFCICNVRRMLLLFLWAFGRNGHYGLETLEPFLTPADVVVSTKLVFGT